MKKTLSGFYAYVGEQNAPLVRAVKKQLGTVSANDFFDTLKNVAASPYGAAAGFGGFIYYHETCSFWRKNRKIILRMMTDLSWELGEDLLSSVMSYTGIKNLGATTDEVGRALYGNYDEKLLQIYNVFAWGALEEVAHWYEDFDYNAD